MRPRCWKLNDLIHHQRSTCVQTCFFIVESFHSGVSGKGAQPFIQRENSPHCWTANTSVVPGSGTRLSMFSERTRPGLGLLDRRCPNFEDVAARRAPSHYDVQSHIPSLLYIEAAPDPLNLDFMPENIQEKNLEVDK